MKKIAIIIIILTVIAAIVGFVYYQRNIYSKDILKLEILAQEGADLLEEVSYVVKYKNNGNIRLEDPELIFEYPDHSILTDGTAKRVVKKSEELGGVIYPGQEKTFTFTARLVGQEGEAKEAKAVLSYRPKDIKARYNSQTSFTTIIRKVPLNFDLDLFSRIESGKELSFRLNYFSNIDYPISNLRVMVDYPSGFEFIDSTPRALDKTEWEIGLLNKSEGGRIEVSGRIAGEVGEEKIFRAKIGIWSEGEFVLLKESARGIAIIRPALYVTQQINNNPKYVANPGDLLRYEIFFRNVGEEPLSDMFLVVNLIGQAFDFQTVQATEGDFTAGDNSIIWDWRRVSDLRFLPSQEEGRVEFWVRLKDEWSIKSPEDKSPEIRTRVFLSQVREDFVNKVNSRLTLWQAGHFHDEVFGNSGPLPPSVGQTTTYTITWQAKNYYNQAKDVKVKAFLPQNVSLTGRVFPEEQIDKITFDSGSREIIWHLDEMAVGQGVLSAPPSISFQIAFKPQANQKETIAELISQARIIGQDAWTGEIIQSVAPAVSTDLPNDQFILQEQGIIQ